LRIPYISPASASRCEGVKYRNRGSGDIAKGLTESPK
jgi:hypothetical protein